jgi:ATP-dependent phosphoenolpyruvate carboxykinase
MYWSSQEKWNHKQKHRFQSKVRSYSLKIFLILTILNSVAELYEYALQPEHLTSCDPNIYPTTISDTGALSVSSGLRTGRSPKDKRVVLDEVTKDVII